jgi:hypothetical protein
VGESDEPQSTPELQGCRSERLVVLRVERRAVIRRCFK